MFSTSTCCPIRWTNCDDILTYISYSCRQPSLPGATDAEELAAGTDGKNPTDSPKTTEKGIYIGSDKDSDSDQASDVAEDAALTDKYDPNSTPQKGDSGT